MTQPNAYEMEGFSLGSPALVCRWRIAGGTLPLLNRHLRALRARNLGGQRVSTQLVAWAKQNVEWSLAKGSLEHPDGVLMLIVDEAGQAAMTVGPYEPLRTTALRSLADRARDAATEAEQTDVAPETLVLVSDGALLVDARPGQRPSGVLSLVTDLAKTLAIPVRGEEGLAAAVAAGQDRQGEYLLVSDEHGIVVAANREGSLSGRLAAGYQTLLDKARDGRRT